MSQELTVEDQLVADLVAAWNTTPPVAVPIVNFRRTEARPVPGVIIGHEGCTRENAKGMKGTGRVALRLAVGTDLDVTTPAVHAALVSALDLEALALPDSPAQLALTYVHAVLREPPMKAIEDRRQITVLAYTVIATQCEETA